MKVQPDFWDNSTLTFLVLLLINVALVFDNYLIKWQNFPLKCTWEPTEHLNDVILAFLKEHPVRITGRAK